MTDLNAVSAATAADPYPYYERLVAQRSFFRDDALGMWVAASAEAVEEVLACTQMHVRPPAEPVPSALAGTSIGRTFSRLIRMNDGAPRSAARQAVVTAFEGLDVLELGATSERCANLLAQTLTAQEASLAEFLLGLPALVIATELGFSPNDSLRAIVWTRDFVRSLAPQSTAEEIERGAAAVESLSDAVQSLRTRPLTNGSLLARLAGESRRRGVDDAVMLANAVGLFLQGYDATAGLIGNTLVTLARNAAETADSARRDPALLWDAVEEVARYDSPVQNTRRFAAQHTRVRGSVVCEGETVLVVLAAANRDPLANSDPQRFDPKRKTRRVYTYGFGAHACMGARFATTVACAGVSALLIRGLDLHSLTQTCYRPAANVRIPDFSHLRLPK